MKTFLTGLCLLVSLLFVGTAMAASTLTWDRNDEADMKDYHVYVCVVKGCTVVMSPATLHTTVTQTAVGILPKTLLPVGKEGAAAVTARDTEQNESGLSVQVPFDTAAPKVPVGVRIQ